MPPLILAGTAVTVLADDTSDITAAVTINKAMLSDAAISIITNINNGTPLPPAIVINPVTPNTAAPTDLNGTAQNTVANGTPAIDVGVAGEVILRNGATVSTSGTGSAGIIANSANSALSVQVDGGSTISTTGENSAAIGGGAFSNSVLNVDIVGDGTNPVLTTTGNNAAGIQIGNGSGGNSTATVAIVGAEAAGATAGMSTSGSGSDLIHSDTTGTSSISISVENSILQTDGATSDILDLTLGDSSDALVILEGSTLRTTDSGSNLVDIQVGNANTTGIVIVDSTLDAAGAGSSGFLLANGSNSSNTVFVSGSMISTTGSAFAIDDGGASSVRTVFFSDSNVNTSEAGASAIDVGGLGSGSAFEFLADTLSVMTLGNNSNGIKIGGTSDGSAQSSTFEHVTVSTQGDNSTAILIAGQTGPNSVISTELDDVDLTTAGAGSAGFELITLPGSGSTATVSVNDVTITTNGANSNGFTAGATDIATSFGGPVDGSSLSISVENTTINTTGNGSTGTTISGFGDGATNSDSLLVVDNTTVNTLGDDSAGMLFDFFGDNLTDTTNTTVLSDIMINTMGNRSSGLVVGDGGGSNNNLLRVTGTVFFSNLNISTTGEDSFGLGFDPFGANAVDSTLSATGTNTTITTSGARAHGLMLGEGDAALTNMTVNVSGADAHGITIDSASVGTQLINLNSGTIQGGTGAGAGVSFSGSLTGHNSVLENLATIGSLSGTAIIGGNGNERVTNGGTLNGTVNFGLGEDTMALLPIGIVNGTVGGGGDTDTLILSGSGMQTFDQTEIGTKYNSFETFEKDGTSTWTLSNLSGEPIWEVIEGELVVQNQLIDPIVSGFTVHSGATLTLSNIVAASPDVARDNRFEIHAGSTVTGNVNAGNGTDTFVLGGTGNANFDNALIGTQYLGFDAFLKEDASTWTLSGADRMAAIMPGTVADGTLVVDADLSTFDLNVQALGRLEGIGGTRDLTVSGAFAPGNSIGTFTVAGDFTLLPGSVFEVELAADGTSDLVTVLGNTTLAGTVAINGIGYPAGYPNAQDYIVITSPNAIAGTFDTVTDNLPDVDATVTINQPVAATMSDPAMPGTVVIGYDLGVDESDKSIHPNTSQAMLTTGRNVAEMLSMRARMMNSGSGQGFTIAPLAYGDNGDEEAATTNEPLDAFWTALVGSTGSTDTTSVATGYDANSAGVLMGWDRSFDTQDHLVRFGVSGGYTNTSVSSGQSSTDVESWHLGTYLRAEQGSRLFSASLNYGFQDYNFTRGIPLGGGGVATAKGEADGNLFAVSTAYSYDVAPALGIDKNNTLRVAPLVRFDHVNVERDAFTETGAGVLNLTVGSDSFSRSWISAGVEMSGEYQTESGMNIKPTLELRWEHAVGDTTPSTASMIASVAGASFTANGAVQDRDLFALGAGVSMEINEKLSAHLRYDGSFAANTNTHRASAGLTFKF